MHVGRQEGDTVRPQHKIKNPLPDSGAVIGFPVSDRVMNFQKIFQGLYPGCLFLSGVILENFLHALEGKKFFERLIADTITLRA